MDFADGRSLPPEAYVRRNRAGSLIEVRTRQLPGGGVVRTYSDVTAYLEAQRALRDNEAGLRALLDAFPGFIAVMDAEFNYNYANERFAALLGRPRDMIVGRSVRALVGEEQFERIRANATSVHAGEQVTVESEYQPSGGETSPRTTRQSSSPGSSIWASPRVQRSAA